MLSLAKTASETVATDLQIAFEGSKEYDPDFLSAADAVFVSHEKLPTLTAEAAFETAPRSGPISQSAAATTFFLPLQSQVRKIVR